MSSDRFLRQRTPFTAELLELEATGALTSDERDNWQRHHMYGFAPGDSMSRYEERLLETVRARELRKVAERQQPAMLAVPASPRRTGAASEPRVGTGGSIALPALKPMNGSLAPRPGERRGRRRFDIDLIKAENPVPQYLARRGIQVKGGKTRCFVHNSNSEGTMAIYKDHAHCFSCGWTGNVIQIAMALDGIDFVAACNDLGGHQTTELRPWVAAGRPEVEEPVELGQRDFTPLATRAHDELIAQRTPLARKAAEYLCGRGLTEDDWMMFTLGIIGQDTPDDLLPLTSLREWPDGKTERRPARNWKGRILMPDINEYGDIVYAKARRFLPLPRPLRPGEKEPLKYLNPSGLSVRLFGFGRALPEGPLLLVEGELDAITAWVTYRNRVVGLPGVKALKEGHARELAARLAPVYLLLDPDCAITTETDDERKIDARDMVQRLLKAGVDLRLVPPMTEDPKADLNDLLVRLGRQEFNSLLRQRVKEAVKLKAEQPDASDGLEALIAAMSEGDARVL